MVEAHRPQRSQSAHTKMTSQSDIKDKIKKLREYWFDDENSLKFVVGVEKRLRALVLKEKLKDSKVITDIVEETRKRISAVNALLTNDEEMSEMNRKLLFRERKVYNFFLDRLDGKKVDQQFESVGRLLDEELKNAGLMKDEDEN